MYNGIFIKHSAKIKNAKLYIKFSFPRENVMRGVSDYRSFRFLYSCGTVQESHLLPPFGYLHLFRKALNGQDKKLERFGLH